MMLRRYLSSSSSSPRRMKRISYVKIVKPISPTTTSLPTTTLPTTAPTASPSIVERVVALILEKPFRAAFFVVGLGVFTTSFLNKSQPVSFDGNPLGGDSLFKGYLSKKQGVNSDMYYISITNLNDRFNRYTSSIDAGMRTTTNINSNANAVKIKTKINEKIQSTTITSPTINASTTSTSTSIKPTTNGTTPTPTLSLATPTPTPIITPPPLTVKKKKVFVLDFNGGITASQCKGLREEITAILLAIKHDTYINTDEKYEYSVILKLKSGGGTVTGYGLAAAQLARLREEGIHLTVLIDELAASGGYMMAVIGDKIVAAPFAMIGSIGVVSTVPNFSRLLKKWGIDVSDYTAGRYKRTVTPYKPETSRDRAKLQQDLNEIHNLFKQHVKLYRPKLNIYQVATGEVWAAVEAKRRGLVDEIKTSDKYILDLYNENVTLYEVKLKKKKVKGLLTTLTGDSNNDDNDDASPPGVHIVSRIIGDTMLYVFRELAQGNEIENDFENTTMRNDMMPTRNYWF